jgi:SH3-like domain-containing protein
MRTSRSTNVLSSADEAATKVAVLPANSIVRVHAAVQNWYRVELPDGTAGYLQSNKLTTIAKPVKAIKISSATQLVFDKPDTAAALKATIPVNSRAEVLGYSGDFSLIKGEAETLGWINAR